MKLDCEESVSGICTRRHPTSVFTPCMPWLEGFTDERSDPRGGNTDAQLHASWIALFKNYGPTPAPSRRKVRMASSRR